MALNATTHANAVAEAVQTKYLMEFNAAMSVRLSRIPVTLAQTDFDTGESSGITDYNNGTQLIDKVVYEPKGDGTDDVDTTWSSIISNTKSKDGSGADASIDQTMMLAIAEATMIATRESMRLAAQLHVDYIKDNIEVSLKIPALGTQFNFPVPAIPAAPAPLIPAGAQFTVGGSSGNLINGGIA